MKFEFHHRWGGQETWYTKSMDWARNQKYPWNQICKGIIQWLWKHWVDGKIEMEMDSVDKQTESILKEWEEDAAKYYERPKPEIVERGVFGEEGWSISVSDPSFDRGSEESESGMGTTSNEIRLAKTLPERWDESGDWNDAYLGYYYESRKHSGDVEEG